jgi:cobalt/nickel transport system permease protein
VTRGRGIAAVVVAGLVVAGLLAVLVGPQASSEPDGLERVAIDEGFADRASRHALENAPTAEYQVDGVDDEGLSTGLAGLIGILVTFAVAGGLLLVARRLPRGRTGPG